MTNERIYQVVVNHEEQYSIWPSDKALPPGWQAVEFKGDQDACIKWIDDHWMDMTPASLREATNTGVS